MSASELITAIGVAIVHGHGWPLMSKLAADRGATAAARRLVAIAQGDPELRGALERAEGVSADGAEEHF